MPNIEQVREVKEKHSIELLAKPLVVGVGVGSNIVNEEFTGEPCIRVYVTHKISGNNIEREDKIPEEIDGVMTDVVEGAPAKRAAAHDVRRTAKERVRPARPGCSISHYATSSRGTMGPLVVDKDTDELLFLSNWHVIANYGMCKKGDPILQPGRLDNGTLPDDIIGYLDRWQDVRMLSPLEGSQNALSAAKKRIRKAIEHDIDLPVNYVDAAAAKPVSADAINSTPLGSEYLQEAADSIKSRYDMSNMIGPEEGRIVTKSGASTGVTGGIVVDRDYDTLIIYPNIGVALFKDQNLGYNTGVGNPMKNVLSALQIDSFQFEVRDSKQIGTKSSSTLGAIFRGEIQRAVPLPKSVRKVRQLYNRFRD